MKNKFWILIILIGIVSCGGLNDAKKVLRNEKISNTDEFLIQKKDPLVLPPDYEKIPEPGTIVKKKADEKDKIRKILNSSKKDNISKNQSSSTEESILEKIR